MLPIGISSSALIWRSSARVNAEHGQQAPVTLRQLPQRAVKHFTPLDGEEPLLQPRFIGAVAKVRHVDQTLAHPPLRQPSRSRIAAVSWTRGSKTLPESSPALVVCRPPGRAHSRADGSRHEPPGQPGRIRRASLGLHRRASDQK